MGYPYSVRREHYRRNPWYVMVKERQRQFIHCAKGTIELTSSKGERFEVGFAVTTATRLAAFLVDGKFVGVNIRVVRDFPDVFPEELPGMPPYREVEFVIDILPGTTLTSKRPYEMSVEELKGLKKQLTKLQEAGYIRPSLHLGEHQFCLYRRKMYCKGCAWIKGPLMVSL
jgi:hypothetical protein